MGETMWEGEGEEEEEEDEACVHQGDKKIIY